MMQMLYWSAYWWYWRSFCSGGASFLHRSPTFWSHCLRLYFVISAETWHFGDPIPSCNKCNNCKKWNLRAHTHIHTHAIGRVIPEVTSLLESANPRANETNKRVNEIKAQRRFHLTGDRSAAVLRRCCVLGFLLCFHTKQAACTGVVRWPAYSSALEESS